MIGCLSNVVSKRNFSVEIYYKRKGTCFIVQNTTFYLFLCVKNEGAFYDSEKHSCI